MVTVLDHWFHKQLKEGNDMTTEEITNLIKGAPLATPETIAATDVALAPYTAGAEFVQLSEDVVGEDEPSPTVH